MTDFGGGGDLLHLRSIILLLSVILMSHGVVNGQGTCPDGSLPLVCTVNPCERSDVIECRNYPDAICVPDSCQLCNAAFFDPINGRRVDCGEDSDDDEVVPRPGDETYEENGKPQRPDHHDNRPPEREEPTTCPDGSELVECVVSPCDVIECPASPDAFCVPNYCGGCNAVFYDRVRRVRVDCTGSGADEAYTRRPRPDEDENHTRPPRPEDSTKRPRPEIDENATRPPLPEGDDDRRPVPEDDDGRNPRPDEDEDKTRRPRPEIDEDATRPPRPEGDDDRRPVRPDEDEDSTRRPRPDVDENHTRRPKPDEDTTRSPRDYCPDGSEPVECVVNPCDVIECPAYPDAFCVPTYCGGCNAVFYDRRRRVRVDCSEDPRPDEDEDADTTRRPRPDGDESYTRRPKPEDESRTRPPKPDEGLTRPPRPDEGFTRPPRSDEGHTRRPKPDEDTTRPPRDACPDGSEPSTCEISPCDVIECPAYPEAFCVPNNCGGCNAVFYDRVRRVRVDCSVDGGEDTTDPPTRDENDIFPIIANCPQDMEVPIPSDLPFVVAIWSEPTASDASGATVPLQDKNYDAPRRYMGAGETAKVRYVFEDRQRNSATCEFAITGVEDTGRDDTRPSGPDEGDSSRPARPDDEDTIPSRPENGGSNRPSGGEADPSPAASPVISNCPENRQVTVPSYSVYAEATWVEPTAVTSSGEPATLQDRSVAAPRMYMTAGQTTNVRYVFEDRERNSATCEFTITAVEDSGREDSIPPRPDEEDSRPDEDNTRPSRPDEADDSSRPFRPDGGDPRPGTNNGVVISNCPENMQASIPPNELDVEVTWEEPTAVDTSGNTVSSQFKNFNEPRVSLAPGDTQVVRYVFENGAGNSAFCIFTITAVQETGYSNLCLPVNPCPSGQLCFYSASRHERICIASTSNDRTRRDVTDVCHSDSCGPHSSCVPVREGDFICLCDAGWQTPYCYAGVKQTNTTGMIPVPEEKEYHPRFLGELLADHKEDHHMDEDKDEDEDDDGFMCDTFLAVGAGLIFGVVAVFVFLGLIKCYTRRVYSSEPEYKIPIATL